MSQPEQDLRYAWYVAILLMLFGIPLLATVWNLLGL